MANSPNQKIKAISLLSGGLDSILATRVVQDQGVEVDAVHFMSPFFSADKRGREDEIAEYYSKTFGINVRIVDISEDFFEILGNPKYGYGKNFNPCIDCKIFLISKALKMMEEEGAKFLITGEVLGQRPMSQRRDAMNAIIRDTETKGILLRPLCAKLLPPTVAEEEGWVDREKLYGFSGRSRKPQMELAKALGIDGYPTPAGGCRLTDPTLAARTRNYFDATRPEDRDPEVIRLILTGRPFVLPGGSVLTLGRNMGENRALENLFQPGDEYAKVVELPGPLGIFRYSGAEGDRQLAGSVMIRYCPKANGHGSVGFGNDRENPHTVVEADSATEEQLAGWRA